MPDLERRGASLSGAAIETRADGVKTLRGHAAVFNQLSEDLGGFREQLTPGAFTEALLISDIRALFNHDGNFVLGRNRAGTLRLAEDARGLAIEIDLPDTQFARDLAVSIARGDVDQMSFGFEVAPGGSTWAQEGGATLRTITKIGRLYDVSPVTFPAYPQTDVALRGLKAFAAAKDAPDPASTLDPAAEIDIRRFPHLALMRARLAGL